MTAYIQTPISVESLRAISGGDQSTLERIAKLEADLALAYETAAKKAEAVQFIPYQGNPSQISGLIMGVLAMFLGNGQWVTLAFVILGMVGGLYLWSLEFNRRERRKIEAAEYWKRYYTK